jgi:hypothetical protein
MLQYSQMPSRRWSRTNLSFRLAMIKLPLWSRNSPGLKRRGLQPRLVSSDCLFYRLNKAYNSAFP